MLEDVGETGVGTWTRGVRRLLFEYVKYMYLCLFGVWMGDKNPRRAFVHEFITRPDGKVVAAQQLS